MVYSTNTILAHSGRMIDFRENSTVLHTSDVFIPQLNFADDDVVLQVCTEAFEFFTIRKSDRSDRN